VSGEDATATVGVNVQPFVTGIQQLVPAGQDAANKSAKVMSDTYSAEFGKIVQVGAAAARRVGGEFGSLGTDISRVIRPLASISPELAAIGASAVAVGAVGIAIDSMATAAQSAAQQLDKLGVVFDPTARADIDAYTKAQQDLSIALDNTKITMGSGFAEALGIVDSAFAQDLNYLTRFVDKIGTATLDVTGLRGELDKLAKAVGADPTAASNQNAFTAMLQDQIKAQPAVDAAFTAQINGQKRLNDTVREGVLARDRLAQADNAWALKDMLQTADAVVAQDKYVQAAKDAALAQQKSLSDAGRYWDDFTAQVDSDLGDLKTAITDVDRQIGQSLDEWERQRAQAFLDVANQNVNSITSVTQLEIDSIQQRVDAGQKLTVAQAAQGNAALDLQEGLAIAQAGIQATMAGLGTYAELAPFLTPLGAAAVATATSAAAYAAAVAGIVAHEPAQFHAGSSPYAVDPQGAADSAIAAKGGSVDTSHGSDSGVGRAGQGPQAPGGKGNVDRTRGGGQIDFSPEASRLLRWKHRAGKRDPRGRR
jgi:hypothetical protein